MITSLILAAALTGGVSQKSEPVQKVTAVQKSAVQKNTKSRRCRRGLFGRRRCR